MESTDGSDGLQELVRRLESSDRPTRERGLAEKYSNQGKITTLMLRNIPSQYTQDMLLEELVDCMGSSDSFDFFYLPWDQQNDCNIGYAFVNFRTVQSAERCTRIFTNFSFRRFDSPKICKVYPAHIQGLENNVLHLMDRAVSEARSHYPIIMWKGEKLKLGKVIAALDVHRRQMVPASAPGKFAGDRRPLVPPGSTNGGMNMDGMDRPGNDAEDYFAGGEGHGDEGELFGPGSFAGLEAPVNPDPHGFARMQQMPHRDQGSRQGRPPPGLAPEAEVVEALPGLRAVLNCKRNGSDQQHPYVVPASMPGGLRLPRNMVASNNGMGGLITSPPSNGPWPPGPVNTGDGDHFQGRNAMAPPANLLPTGNLQAPGSFQGLLQAPGSLHGALQASGPQVPGALQPPGSLQGMQGMLQPPGSHQGMLQAPGSRRSHPQAPANLPPSSLAMGSRVPGGLLPPGALPPGAVQPAAFESGLQQEEWQGGGGGGGGLFETFVPQSAQPQGLSQPAPPPLQAPNQPGPSPGGGDGGLRTIELKNPDDDVLSKFLGRFGS